MIYYKGKMIGYESEIMMPNGRMKCSGRVIVGVCENLVGIIRASMTKGLLDWFMCISFFSTIYSLLVVDGTFLLDAAKKELRGFVFYAIVILALLRLCGVTLMSTDMKLRHVAGLVLGYVVGYLYFVASSSEYLLSDVESTFIYYIGYVVLVVSFYCGTKLCELLYVLFFKGRHIENNEDIAG